ncbi:hypothetical protein LINPERPRIM_LOCUS30248, partial [Linum perenne]
VFPTPKNNLTLNLSFSQFKTVQSLLLPRHNPRLSNSQPTLVQLRCHFIVCR